MKHLLLLLALTAVLSSCIGRQAPSAEGGGDTIPLRYARNLVMVQYPDRLEAVVRNPWDSTKVLHRYLIVPQGENLSTQSGDSRQATVIHAPLQRAAVFSSVHCALLTELGCQDAIGGVCEVQYIHVPYVLQGVRDGSIADLGNGLNPNLERIMDLRPDALMPSPFENSGGYGRLERTGIPIVECADYMEVSPLARAEWMRFYGRLFGQGEKADSLFLAVEQRYLSLCRQAQQTLTRPRLICETPQGNFWYLPGGNSTMGQLYRDAGADYLFSDLEGSGSTSLSTECVLDRALGAQVWLVKHSGMLTRQQIIQDCPALRRMTASLWLCNLSTSNFYEETPFHPERLLQAFIHILHPELGIKAEKLYFCPVKE